MIIECIYINKENLYLKSIGLRINNKYYNMNESSKAKSNKRIVHQQLIVHYHSIS